MKKIHFNIILLLIIRFVNINVYTINFIIFEMMSIKLIFLLFSFYGDWGLGIGDWGLGIVDWAQSPIPNSQSPIPNPQSPSPIPKNIYISKIFL